MKKTDWQEVKRIAKEYREMKEKDDAIRRAKPATIGDLEDMIAANSCPCQR